MQLYGKDWSERDLRARIGHPDQIAGVRRYRLVEGPGDGIEQIEVRTGSGLRYIVSPHRGLDIGFAEFCGVPLSWMSPNGDVHPAYFQPHGTEWLRTAAGGLLMTCGMTQVGSPCEDDGESLGIHGRVHHTAASDVSAQSLEDAFVVRGRLRETRMFGENLELVRTISSQRAGNTISIQDAITNHGFHPSPLMLLYHFNFGFPLLTEATRIEFPSNTVVPRPPDKGIDGYQQWQSPDPAYRERVYYHSDLQTQSDPHLGKDVAEVRIINPDFHDPMTGAKVELDVSIRWDVTTLPRLVQWKMCGAGMHVLGIEPANCWVGGRRAEREAGSLKWIQPGETVRTDLVLGVTTRPLPRQA